MYTYHAFIRLRQRADMSNAHRKESKIRNHRQLLKAPHETNSITNSSLQIFNLNISVSVFQVLLSKHFVNL